MPDEAKRFEVALTIVIAISAALVGVAGYLSAEMHTVEDRARARSLIELNEANTNYLEANQLIDFDWQLFIQAELASYDGHEEEARFLRSQMNAVQLGYFDQDGNASTVYGGDTQKAWKAYEDEMYRAYDESKKASDQALDQAEYAAQKGLDYLFSTAVLAIAAMMGTVGMTAKTPKLRLTFLLLGAVALAGASTLIVFTLFV